MSGIHLQDWKKRFRFFMRAPRQLRPTRAGWMFLLINFGVGFAALNTGNNLLYLVLSLLLAFLTLSGLLSESALRGIEIRRTLPREVYARCDNTVRLEVRNTQRKVPAFAIVVQDRSSPPSASRKRLLGDWRLVPDRELPVVGRVFALRVGPASTESRSYALRPEHRGSLEFHSVRISTRFPFGLFLKSRTISAPGSALVFPEINPIRTAAPLASGESHSDAVVRVQSGGIDVTGVREWKPGDSQRRVHWKSSLRRNRLCVRTAQEDQRSEIEVHLRTRLGSLHSPFEEHVNLAASEVVSHLAAGLRVGLVTDSEQIRADASHPQRLRLLSFLALVKIDESREKTDMSVSNPLIGQAQQS
jgi:uncharacterized protein (DUF58 family)